MFAITAAVVLDAADWLPHKSILHLAHGKMEEKVLRPSWKQHIADFQRSTTALMPSPCKRWTPQPIF